MTDKTTKPGTNLLVLADARKRKADTTEAPLEAVEPGAHKFDGEDAWFIRGCDGEQEYMWIARKKTRRSKGYTVTEVFPGLAKKKTDLREALEADDLVMCKDNGKTQTYVDIGDVIEELWELLFEGLEEDDDGDGDGGGEEVRVHG